MIRSQLIGRCGLFVAAAIGAMAISFSVQSVLASSNSSTGAPKISCEVAMSRMLHRNGYGLNLQSLTPGTVVNSFKVSDLEQSMAVANKAVQSLPAEFELPPELEKELTSILKKLEPLEKRDAVLQAEIHALTHEYDALLEIENGAGLRQTIQYISDKLTAKKIEAAKLQQDQLNPLYAEYDKFTSVNRIYPKGVGKGVVRYVQFNEKSKELAKAIAEGDVADAHRRAKEIRRSMISGPLSFPFD